EEDGEVNVFTRDIGRDFFRAFQDVDGEDVKAVFAVTGFDFHQFGQGLVAMVAPSRPKIKEDRLTAKRRKRRSCAVEVGQGKIRSWLSDDCGRMLFEVRVSIGLCKGKWRHPYYRCVSHGALPGQVDHTGHQDDHRAQNDDQSSTANRQKGNGVHRFWPSLSSLT